MDAVCVDALEGLIPVTIEDNEEASGPIPFTVSLEFDTDNLVGTELWIDEPNGVASISFCLQFSVLSFTDVNGMLHESLEVETLGCLLLIVFERAYIKHVPSFSLKNINLQMKPLPKLSPSRQ